IAQLIINSRINTSIEISLFFAVYKFNTKLPISIVRAEARLGAPLLSTKKRVY
ncbi:hypothetical protein QR685DRAFT_438681, partial [Neurospora intermedia]